MRNEDSGVTLQTSPTVAPTRAAQQPFTSGVAVQATKAAAPTTQPAPRLDADSKAALS